MVQDRGMCVMTKRIEEIADECRTIHGRGFGTGNISEPEETFDYEKFAKLIIRECLSYISSGDLDFAKFMIKGSFGIE